MRLTVYTDTSTLYRKSSVSLLLVVMRWRSRQWHHWRCCNHQNLAATLPCRKTYPHINQTGLTAALQHNGFGNQFRIQRLQRSEVQVKARWVTLFLHHSASRKWRSAESELRIQMETRCSATLIQFSVIQSENQLHLCLSWWSRHPKLLYHSTGKASHPIWEGRKNSLVSDIVS